MKHEGAFTPKTVSPQSYRASEKDKELVTLLAKYLGSSKSEVVRTAIRHFAAHIGAIDRLSPQYKKIEQHMKELDR